jgi:hypothetical protein
MTTRTSARGAAIPEGIVVIVVMFLFLGMNLWAYKAYGGKIDQASATRRDALYHASHNCEEQSPDPDTYTDPSLRNGGSVGASGENVGVSGGDGRVDTALGNASSQGQTPTSQRSGGMATAEKSGSVSGSATVWNDSGIGKTSFTTPMRTKSFVWCNQKRHDGFTGLFTGAFSAAKGIVDLF